MEEIEGTVRANLAEVLEEIGRSAAAGGRKASEVSVMAVTKTHPAGFMKAAISCGIEHIGENRVTEGGRKIKEIGRDSAIFHAIGVLHRKEVRQAVRDFHWIDAVDSMNIIDEIARKRPEQNILLEINTSGEPAKKGFPPDAALLEEVVGKAMEQGLSLRGFLTVGPLGSDEKALRKSFALLRTLRDRVSDKLECDLPVLSMGMSDDFALAVMEGSTMVRLGRRLFGPRA